MTKSTEGALLAALAFASLAVLAATSVGCRGERRGGSVDRDGFVHEGDAAVDAAPDDDASVPSTRPDASSSACAIGPESDFAACTDGCSNDGDEFIDCEDRDCCPFVACPSSSYCGSREDAGVPTCPSGPESTATACSDGCSNDGDPFVDCEDYDCCDVVSCPASSACGSPPTTTSRYVSTRAADCVGTGSAFYTFDHTTYSMRTVAFATSTGYQVFGYTRGAITSGPFPLTGTTDERQVRVADLGSGLTMALSRWGGSSWTSSEGGSASFSDASSVYLAEDADSLYPTYACVGHVEGSATAPVLGGVDFLHFEFTAPILGLGFPGVR
jgi:hypothetical protein